jgi:hypothetical protein
MVIFAALTKKACKAELVPRLPEYPAIVKQNFVWSWTFKVVIYDRHAFQETLVVLFVVKTVQRLALSIAFSKNDDEAKPFVRTLRCTQIEMFPFKKSGRRKYLVKSLELHRYLQRCEYDELNSTPRNISDGEMDNSQR